MLKKLFARKKEQKVKKSITEYDEDFKKLLCLTSEKAKIIVNQCLNMGFEINTQKLQKLMVLMQGKMLAEYDKPFIKEKIQGTIFGVMIPCVDNDFMQFACGFDKKLIEYITLLDREQEIVDSILRTYGNMDSFELNELRTLKAINSFSLECAPFTTIPNQTIKQVFEDTNFTLNLLGENNKNLD